MVFVRRVLCLLSDSAGVGAFAQCFLLLMVWLVGLLLGCWFGGFNLMLPVAWFVLIVAIWVLCGCVLLAGLVS